MGDLSKVTQILSRGGRILSTKARSLNLETVWEKQAVLNDSPFDKRKNGERNQNLRMESKQHMLEHDLVENIVSHLGGLEYRA